MQLPGLISHQTITKRKTLKFQHLSSKKLFHVSDHCSQGFSTKQLNSVIYCGLNHFITNNPVGQTKPILLRQESICLEANIIEHSAIALQYKSYIRLSALTSFTGKIEGILCIESQKDIQKKNYFVVKGDFSIKPATM